MLVVVVNGEDGEGCLGFVKGREKGK